MSIVFQNPALLWMLPAAAAPVVFHLFFRVRARRRRFPALLFFLAADPRMGSRRRLREILVLALRCLAILAAVLAFARPVARGAAGAAPLALVLVDNSASMAASSPSGDSRLERAKVGAEAILSDAAIRAAAVVTTVADPSAPFLPETTDDSAQLRATLASLRASDSGGDPAAAFSRLRAATGKSPPRSVEVHVFTDLQSADWLRAGQSAPDLPVGAELFIHDVARDGDIAGTVAIASVAPPVHRPVAWRPWSAAVELVNKGPRTVDILVDSSVEGGSAARVSATVPANGSKTVAANFEGCPAGLARARIALSGRDAAPGSVAWLGVEIAPVATALFAGNARTHGLLSAALSPDGTGALTGFVARDASEEEIHAAFSGSGAAPAVVVVTPRQLAASPVSPLPWIEAGGVLVVSPESGAPQGPCDLGELGISYGEAESSPDGARLLAVAPDGDDFWRDLRGADGSIDLRGALSFRWNPVEAAKNGAPLLQALENGAPQNVLARVDVGKGHVFASGMAWDMRASNLPRRAAFLAIARAMALASEREVAMPPVAAGMPVDAGGASAMRIRSVAGPSAEWSGAADAIPPPARAGLYEVVRDGGAPELLAVRGDDSEADSARSAPGDVPMFAGVRHRYLRYNGSAAMLGAVMAARSGLPLYAVFAGLAACFLVAETIIASRAAKSFLDNK